MVEKGQLLGISRCYIHEEDPYPGCISSKSLPLLFCGTSGGCEDGWKEGEEFGQGFVDPEQAEGGFLEGFAAAGERDGCDLAGVSGVPDDNPKDLVDLEDSVRHRFDASLLPLAPSGHDHHLNSPTALSRVNVSLSVLNQPRLLSALSGRVGVYP